MKDQYKFIAIKTLPFKSFETFEFNVSDYLRKVLIGRYRLKASPKLK